MTPDCSSKFKYIIILELYIYSLALLLYFVRQQKWCTSLEQWLPVECSQLADVAFERIAIVKTILIDLHHKSLLIVDGGRRYFSGRFDRFFVVSLTWFLLLLFRFLRWFWRCRRWLFIYSLLQLGVGKETEKLDVAREIEWFLEEELLSICHKNISFVLF